MGPRRRRGGDARGHYGVLHGRWGQLGGAAGRTKAGFLLGCHQEPVAVVSGNGLPIYEAVLPPGCSRVAARQGAHQTGQHWRVQ